MGQDQTRHLPANPGGLSIVGFLAMYVGTWIVYIKRGFFLVAPNRADPGGRKGGYVLCDAKLIPCDLCSLLERIIFLRRK